MINIIIADDHAAVSEGLKALLTTDENLSVTAMAYSGMEVIQHLEQGVPADVILADLNMPVMDGTALLQTVRDRFPAIKVVILSVRNEASDIQTAFEHGARGYLVKTAGSEEIIFAIKHVHKGKKYLCSEMTQVFYKQATSEANSIPSISIDFNDREKEILKMVADGLTNSEMSNRLFLSKRTVEGHRQALIDKTGSKNTAALIKYAIMNGLIS